jgi:PKD repeat protein
MNRILPLILVVFLVSGFAIGQKTTLRPEKVLLPEDFTTTNPLREMEIIPPSEKTDWKNGIVPNNELSPAQRNKTGLEPPVYGPDPVLQQSYIPSAKSSNAVAQNFEGIGNLCGCAPPDTDGDVGPNHYIQMVNNAFQIFDKAGNPLTPPANLSTIWSSLPGPWVGTSNGDPIVLYDEMADRWLLTQFSLPNFPDGPFYELIAVSAGSDPTGAYHLYAYSFDDMPDYPKFGIWPDGYYMSINQFTSGSLSWAGAGAAVFERDQMLVGNSATMVFFNFNASQDPWSFLPSDIDGPIPPSGTPNYFVYLEDVFTNGTDRLRIHELSVDWGNPNNSTFSSPVDLNVAAFNPIVGGIPQPGASPPQTLDPLSDRLMHRLQYRNFGTHQTLVTNHTVNTGSGAGIRWYELRNTGSGWTIYQQGTYAPADGNQRWMASVAMNGAGDIALGYSIAGGISPSIRYTGRQAGDPLGTMTIPETTIITGSGSQAGTDRWGDYSAMAVDPVDDFTFWYTQEYVNPGGNFAWRTRIASFDFYTPSLPPIANFTVNTTNTEVGQTVTFTDISSFNPSSWTWSITPSTYTFANGTTAESQNPQVQFSSSGAYSVTLNATNTYGSDSETKTDYINVEYCQDFTLPFSEDFSDASLPSCWQNIDNVGNYQVWQFGTITGYTPNPSLSGNYAYLNSDAYGSTNSQNADLVTPAFNLSGYTSVNLSFDHYYRHVSGSSGTLSYSTDGGSNWTTIQTWTASTANPASFSQDIGAIAGQSNVKLRWKYTGTWGYYWAIDDISLTGIYDGTPGLWTGTVSSDWADPTNWDNHAIPLASDDITIPSTAPNWPIFDGDLTTGAACNNITLEGSSQLTVAGDFTLSPGTALTVLNDGMLEIGGGWTNNGTYNPGSGLVSFNGAAPGIINVSAADVTTYLIDEDFEDGLGSWDGNIAASTENFNVFSGNNAGGISPEVRFTGPTGNPSSDMARFFHSPLNTIGLATLDFSFKHMVDHANGNGYTLSLEYSLDGSSWENAGWSVLPTNDISASVVALTLDAAQGVGAENLYLSFTIAGNFKKINYWYIDDVQLSYTTTMPGEEAFYDLTISKTNAEVSTAGNITVNNNLTVKPGAYFTNATGNDLSVAGDLHLEASETSMASFIDEGNTTVAGNAIVEQYLAYDALAGYQNHLVSSPISNATLNTYYNLYFYAYDEAGTDGSYWDNIYEPLDFPLAVGQGYNATGSQYYTGTTTVLFNTGPGGVLNNSDVTFTNFTRNSPNTGYVGFELVGNPFQSALEWNGNWPMSNLSGWMLVWDYDTYRGWHTDGTDHNDGTAVIPASQGFFVRAIDIPASLTIPAAERIHDNQAFYKNPSEYPHPILRIEASSSEHADEAVVVFHPEGSDAFDGYYDLSKFSNAEGVPSLYTVTKGHKYGFNVLSTDYANRTVPLHFKINNGGIYALQVTDISNFSDEAFIYLEDRKENTITELNPGSEYVFGYEKYDNTHRFNLLFKDSPYEEAAPASNTIRIYARGNTVYVQTPEQQQGIVIVFDVLGQEVLRTGTDETGNTVIRMDARTGYYFVSVQTGEEFTGTKVLIRQ